MGIEDHIRDIIRQKVNERVGQEIEVHKRDLRLLVKNVVRGEIKEHVDDHHRVPNKREPSVEVLEKFRRDSAESSCLNAGDAWNEKEDERLDREMACAVTWISALHSRSRGGIKARLRKHAEDTDCRPLI